jgi:hypothetical protein
MGNMWLAVLTQVIVLAVDAVVPLALIILALRSHHAQMKGTKPEFLFWKIALPLMFFPVVTCYVLVFGILHPGPEGLGNLSFAALLAVMSSPESIFMIGAGVAAGQLQVDNLAIQNIDWILYAIGAVLWTFCNALMLRWLVEARRRRAARASASRVAGPSEHPADG